MVEGSTISPLLCYNDMKTNNSSAYTMPNVGCKIGKVYQKLSSQLEASLAESGLNITASEYLVMRVLYSNDGLQQCEIVDTLGKDKASVCRTVASLARKGYVTTEPVSHKCLRVWVSDQGRKIQHLIDNVALKRHKALEAVVNAGEMDIFVKVLDQILDN